MGPMARVTLPQQRRCKGCERDNTPVRFSKIQILFPDVVLSVTVGTATNVAAVNEKHA